MDSQIHPCRLMGIVGDAGVSGQFDSKVGADRQAAVWDFNLLAQTSAQRIRYALPTEI